MPTLPNTRWLAALLLLASAHCHTQPAPPLAGTVTLTRDWKPMIYLIRPQSFGEIAASFTGQVVDSAQLAPDGQFAFTHLPLSNEPTLFELCVQPVGSRYANQLLDDNPTLSNYAPVVLKQGEPLYVMAHAPRFQATFLVKYPTLNNLLLRRLTSLRYSSYQTQAPLLAPGQPHDENNLLAYEDAVRQFREPLMAFADTCQSLLPALVATRWVSPNSDYERVPEFVFRQCEKWQKKAPYHPFSAQLCQVAGRDKLPVLTGDTLLNFPLPMVSGDTLPLHQLLGKRLTVLDVWASWCAPCRRENREVLVPLWDKYRTQGLQIVGYSIDAGSDAWRAAIAKDQAAWPHASHLTGDSTPFTEALRITTIPANFLLDAQGRVVAKNLHGAALTRFVVEYLKS